MAGFLAVSCSDIAGSIGREAFSARIALFLIYEQSTPPRGSLAWFSLVVSLTRLSFTSLVSNCLASPGFAERLFGKKK